MKLFIKKLCQSLIYLASKKSPPSSKTELTKVSHSAARALNWKDYKINLNLDTIIGHGFLSVFYKISLTNNITKEEIKLAVKRAPELQQSRTINAVEYCYRNEILFYTKILPAFQEFQKRHGMSQVFNLVPQYITSVSDLGNEIVVLKDITSIGFQLRDKSLLLDDEHTKFIFKTYGYLHAISFCLKKQKPDEFEALVQPLTKIWNKINKGVEFGNILKSTMQRSYEALSDKDDGPIREKFHKYVLRSIEIFEESTFYHGKYSGFLHGDCWSNNMMFQYKDHQNQKNLEKMNLLDFQIVQTGTPVFDLSYCFYSGVSEKLFDNLEQYLNVYYESFAETAARLGENSHDLLPRKALSEDFQQYSKLGMIFALILTQIRLINKEDTVKMIRDAEKGNTRAEDFGDNADDTLFKQRVADIIRHVYKIKAL